MKCSERIFHYGSDPEILTVFEYLAILTQYFPTFFLAVTKNCSIIPIYQVHEMAMVSAVQEAQKDNLRSFNDYMLKVLEVSMT